jgi:hypothetical protein
MIICYARYGNPAYFVMGEEVKGHSKAPMIWNIKKNIIKKYKK